MNNQLKELAALLTGTTNFEQLSFEWYEPSDATKEEAAPKGSKGGEG